MKTKFVLVAFCLVVLAVGLVKSDAAESRTLKQGAWGVNLAGYCHRS